jgi:hypothetical protein
MGDIDLLELGRRCLALPPDERSSTTTTRRSSASGESTDATR